MQRRWYWAAPPLRGGGGGSRRVRQSTRQSIRQGSDDVVLGRESLWFDATAAGNDDLAEIGARLAVREALVKDNEWHRIFQSSEGVAGVSSGLLRRSGGPPWRLPAGADGSGGDLFTDTTDRFVERA